MKNLKNLGKPLTKAEQKTINGGVNGKVCCQTGIGPIIGLEGTYMGVICIEWSDKRGDCPFTAA